MVVNNAVRLRRYGCTAHVGMCMCICMVARLCIIYDCTCIVESKHCHPLLSIYPYRSQVLTGAMTTYVPTD